MAKRPIVPEDLLRIKIPSDPQLSPDGKSCVFAVKSVGEKNNYVSHLWLWHEGDLRQLTFGEVSDTSPRWRPDGSGISFVSNRRKPKPQILFLPLSGGEPFSLTDLPEGSLGKYEWSPDGASIAFLFREKDSSRTKQAKEEREKSGLSDPPLIVESLTWRMDGDGVFGDDRYKLCLARRADTPVRHNRLQEQDCSPYEVLLDKAKDGAYVWCWEPSSKAITVAYNVSDTPTLEPWKEELFSLDIASKKLTRIEGPSIAEFAAVSWSPDRKWMASAYSDVSNDRFGYKETKLAFMSSEGKWSAPVAGDYDLGVWTLNDMKEAGGDVRLLWDDGFVVSTVAAKGYSHVWRFSPDGKSGAITRGAMELSLTSFVKGIAANVRASKTDLPEIMLLLDNSVDGGRASSRAADGDAPTWQSSFNKEFLEETEIIEPEEHWVDSEAGVKVQTWVIKPKHEDGSKLPCCLEVHGGPHGMYTSSVFFEMQLLAANGYVVVFSNPRGSTGYGEDFARCIKGDWGNKDWADVQAVTKFAKSLPYVDKDRVCIMGGSYGGYMVNWAIGHSDEYKCAITDRCVANLLSKSGNSDYTFIPDGNWPGAAYDNWETLWDRSPVKHFKNVTTPTLVIHSEGDLRCHIEQGEQVYTFLKMRGIPTRFVRYPATTSHGMSRSGPPDMRLHRLREILRWLEEWL